jgi:hypothetical protein
MYDVIVDDNGRVCPVGSLQFYRLFDYPGPDFNLLDYAVRNLGCIHVRRMRGATRIRLRAQRFNHLAFEAVAALMLEWNGGRHVFDHGLDAPFMEIVANLNDALAHLEQLMHISRHDEKGVSLFSDELSLGRLRHEKRQGLRELIKEWKRRRGILGRDIIEPFRMASNAGPVMVVRALPRGSRCTIEYFGPKFVFYDPCWTLSAIGRDVEEQPDRQYGEESGEVYHLTRMSEKPRLELVDAVIRAPGRAPVRSRYERLLLPWRTTTGDVFVSGTSFARARFRIGDDEKYSSRSSISSSPVIQTST